MELANDPRWIRLNDRATPCGCCGVAMPGVFDLGYVCPDSWPHRKRDEASEDVLEVDGDKLSSDLCKHGEHFFVRCTLPIPIIGSEETFAFGPWGSMSVESFQAYLAAEDGEGHFEGCFSWVSNILPGCGMDTFLPADLYLHEDPGLRPQLFIHEGHPLAGWQRDGITFDHLLDIYAAAGNDLRPHLADA